MGKGSRCGCGKQPHIPRFEGNVHLDDEAIALCQGLKIALETGVEQFWQNPAEIPQGVQFSLSLGGTPPRDRQTPFDVVTIGGLSIFVDVGCQPGIERPER